MFHSEDIGREIVVKLRCRPKGGFWALNLQREGTPQILDMRFQIALTSEHVTNFVEFRSASSEIRRRKKKKEKRKKEKSLVKYVRRHICRAA